MSNKPFDLEKALVGEPVKLRSGNKAFVLARIPESEDAGYPLLGYACDKDGRFSSTEQWEINGRTTSCKEDRSLDIVGMWQEPRPRVQLYLPAPLKEPQKGMWFITATRVGKSGYKEGDLNSFYSDWFEAGKYFATKEDAQEWLDAMRNARR